jgi:Dyp-type peroxidase family
MLTDITSKHILGTTELTCLMPIKSGFVGEFETRTYATRLRIAMKVLHGLRVGSREVSPLRVFPDIVDVTRSIHSFQLSIIGNKQLLLAVTFDRPWEPYLRIVWERLGPLLDLLLINCDGYQAHASDKGFDRFSAWVRRHQIEAGLFYAASPCSVDDIRYLTQLESAQLNEVCPEKFAKAAAVMVAIDPVKQAFEVARAVPKIEKDRLAVKVISAFYSLRESYPDSAPDRQDLPDGRYLRSAAREILKTFNPETGTLKTVDTATIAAQLREQFQAELAWFDAAVDEPKDLPTRGAEYKEMQGGILPAKSSKRTDTDTLQAVHGCLLLARVADPVAARAFLRDKLIGFVTRHGGDPKSAHAASGRVGVYTNVAFTFEGLRQLGLSDTELARFPKEFREGMEARAGLIGDVQSNHPTNWSLPEWNWPDLPKSSQVPVRMSTIDIVIKLRISGTSEEIHHAWSENHPLYTFATDLFTDPADTGVRVLSVQPMLQYIRGKDIIDHFGFVDGISQPMAQESRPQKQKNGDWANDVALGELFLGYGNDRGDPDFKKDDPGALPGRELGSLLDNGTFLVVRKLKQNVEALAECVRTFCDSEEGRGLSQEQVLAKMMGRELNGNPLTGGDPPRDDRNDFTYERDADGGQCPLHAHIRRSNPREKGVPRIVRRGMSYGPFDEDSKDERGLMFLAYNASIAEQFEVIQRWMVGGNSTRGYSGHADPFLRVPQGAQAGVFRFVHDGKVRRLNLCPEPLVTLKWGMYLFVPSMSALRAIASEPKPDVEAAKAQIAHGEAVIASLQTDDDWRAIVEDITASHSGTNAAVYSAIRARGGVLRTPGRGMVLVASEPFVMEVLRNDSVFSVSEYKHRMAKSIGEIYLGLDFSEDYVRLSKVNDLVSKIQAEDAFGIAEAQTRNVLSEMLQQGNGGPVSITLETVTDQVLARLSTHWFGVPNDEEIKKGGRPALGTDTIHLPFHSLAPSRYIFSSPTARDVVAAAGEHYGKGLRRAVKELAEGKRLIGFPTQLAQDVWAEITRISGKENPELFARTLVGLIEGFLPTVYGNFLKTMHLWITDETLWRVQQDVRSRKADSNAMAIIEPELKRAMQRRPVPDIIYRTATQRHRLGGITIEAGERVVALIASATHELAEQRDLDPNVMPVFGGNRKEARHPTHACPAYQMGMGVLLGMISALLEAGTLKKTDSPLAITIVPLTVIKAAAPTLEEVGV